MIVRALLVFYWRRHCIPPRAAAGMHSQSPCLHDHRLLRELTLAQHLHVSGLSALRRLATQGRSTTTRLHDIDHRGLVSLVLQERCDTSYYAVCHCSLITARHLVEKPGLLGNQRPQALDVDGRDDLVHYTCRKPSMEKHRHHLAVLDEVEVAHSHLTTIRHSEPLRTRTRMRVHPFTPGLSEVARVVLVEVDAMVVPRKAVCSCPGPA